LAGDEEDHGGKHHVCITNDLKELEFSWKDMPAAETGYDDVSV